jgi:hypothetical protein
MRPAARFHAYACALALSSLAPAAPAQAWTEARIETASAQLQVLPGGRARVSLRLGVRVLGGWLSRLELDGLDPGLVLDPDRPPLLLCEDGQRLAPETRVGRDGRVLITFPSRARAPRRGRHDLELGYFTQLASEPARDGQRTMRWALPAFRADLRDVDVSVNAPAGAALAGTTDRATTTAYLLQGERTTLRWRRAQLPRTLTFEAVFSVPASAALRASPPPAARPGPSPGLGGVAAWPALALLLLAFAKRSAVRASCRHERARALPLLGLVGGPRALAAAALALAAAWVYPAQPLLGGALLAAVSACALDRGYHALPVPQPRWTRARLALERARLRRTYARRLLGGAAWLDATTPLGLGALACAYALALLRANLGAGIDVWLEALLAATPLWLSATRLALPPPALERLYASARQTRSVAEERSDPAGVRSLLRAQGGACPP